jgi:hypothetical protein
MEVRGGHLNLHRANPMRSDITTVRGQSPEGPGPRLRM